MDRELAAPLHLIEVQVAAKLIHPGAGGKDLAVAQTKSPTSSPELCLMPLPELLSLLAILLPSAVVGSYLLLLLSKAGPSTSRRC